MVKSNKIKEYKFKVGIPYEFEIIPLKELFKYKQLTTVPHRTGFYHIIWFQKGSPTHLVDFVPIKIKPNSLLFLAQNVVQSFDKKEDFDGKVILFTDNFFCKTEQDTKFLKSISLFNDIFFVSQIKVSESVKIFENLFQQMEREIRNNKDNFQQDILKNFLYIFLLFSEREKCKQNLTEVKRSADLDYFIIFKDLLESQFKEQRRVSSFAKQINITEKRLNQITSKVLGKTPKQIINERIMLEAKRLLVYTDASIKEIGFALGFDEPTNFIKYFKKHHNYTPLEFRDQLTYN